MGNNDKGFLSIEKGNKYLLEIEMLKNDRDRAIEASATLYQEKIIDMKTMLEYTKKIREKYINKRIKLTKNL